MDGDQLVDIYWNDPMMAAEHIAGKLKYAGNLYLQFEALSEKSSEQGLVYTCLVVSMGD